VMAARGKLRSIAVVVRSEGKLERLERRPPEPKAEPPPLQPTSEQGSGQMSSELVKVSSVSLPYASTSKRGKAVLKQMRNERGAWSSFAGYVL
jgi:hypothetical protein